MRAIPALTAATATIVFVGTLGLLLVVAGGEGIYSAVFNSWGGGEHNVLPVSREIEMNQFCELPMDRQAPAGLARAAT